MIVDRSAQFLRDLKRHLAGNLLEATLAVEEQVKINISRPGRRGTKAAARRLKKSGRSILNRSVRYRYTAAGNLAGFEARSRKGEFPRRQTGALRSSIYHTMDYARMNGRVGTPLRYGAILEKSIRLDRSFLRKTIKAMEHVVAMILMRKM